MRLTLLPILLAVLLTPFTAEAATLLVDEGHGQRFSVAREGPLELSGLGQLLRARGFELKIDSGPLERADLAGVDALLISGAFVDYTPAEQQALIDFIDGGGRVAILLHVGPLNGHLLQALGVGVSRAVLMESERLIDGSPTDFATASLSAHPLVAGLGAFNLYGSWALNPMAGQQVLARVGPGAWLDMNRNHRRDPGEPVHPFAVALVGRRGQGGYAVFGDDAIFQNRFLVQANRQLAERLADWLAPRS